jgi:hypothetical protein
MKRAERSPALPDTALDSETTRRRLLDLGALLPEGPERTPKPLVELVGARSRAGLRS